MVPDIPNEYRQYLETNGSFEGFTTDAAIPGYVVLWSLEEIVGNNADIGIHEHAPGFLAFASDGGGEVLAFDASGRIFMLPLTGMEPRYAQKVANSFGELASQFELDA